jgi:hypothetical protein
MIDEKMLKYLEEIEKRFNERFEYLRRDLSVLGNDLNELEEMVHNYTAEIEKYPKK